jgi:hypothetical protein
MKQLNEVNWQEKLIQQTMAKNAKQLQVLTTKFKKTL